MAVGTKSLTVADAQRRKSGLIDGRGASPENVNSKSPLSPVPCTPYCVDWFVRLGCRRDSHQRH